MKEHDRLTTADLARTEDARAEDMRGHRWDRGDKVTTEDLRVTLQRYRVFFDRLLSV